MHKIDCCSQMRHKVSECLAAVQGNVGGECESAHTQPHAHKHTYILHSQRLLCFHREKVIRFA